MSVPRAAEVMRSLPTAHVQAQAQAQAQAPEIVRGLLHIPILNDTNWDVWHRLTLLAIFVQTRKGWAMTVGLVSLPEDCLLEQHAHLWDEAAKALEILTARVDPFDWPHIERASLEQLRGKPLDMPLHRRQRQLREELPDYHPRKIFLALQEFYGPRPTYTYPSRIH